MKGKTKQNNPPKNTQKPAKKKDEGKNHMITPKQLQKKYLKKLTPFMLKDNKLELEVYQFYRANVTKYYKLLYRKN